MIPAGASGPERPRSSVVTVEAEGDAPRLPIEQPLVRAVRSLEALKGQAESLLLMLEHIPDQPEQLTAAVNEIVARTNAASAAVWQFTQVRSCQGQG